MKLIGFGTVGSGILSDKSLGRSGNLSKREQNTSSLRMYSATAERFCGGDWSLVSLLLNTMKEIALRKNNPNVSIANVAQRFVLQTEGVGSIIVGVKSANHVRKTLERINLNLRRLKWANFGELLPNGRDRKEMFGGLNEVLFKFKGERGVVSVIWPKAADALVTNHKPTLI